MSSVEKAMISRRRALAGMGGVAAAGAGLFVPGIAGAKGLKPAVLKWGSSSLGSTGYVILEALAATANKHTGLRNSSMATSGGAENMALIGEGLIHFGQTTSSDWPAATRGEPPYRSPVRCNQMFAYTLWNMPPIVLASSSIKTFDDLRGKRIMPSQPTSSAGAMWKVLFTAAGMDAEVRWNYGSWQETYDALKSGNADAVPALITNGRPAPVLTELLVSNKVRAIAMPEDVLAKARELNPGILPLEVDPAIWKEEASAMIAPSISGVIGAHPDLDPEICYQVTKAVFDNEDEVRKLGIQLQDIQLKFAVDNLMAEYPVAAGAARYFKERGVWRDELTIAS